MRLLLATLLLIFLAGQAFTASAAETHASGAHHAGGEVTITDWAHPADADDICCDATVAGHCGETPAHAPTSAVYIWPSLAAVLPPAKGRLTHGATPAPVLRPPIV